MDIRIRRADADDAHALSAVARATFLATFADTVGWPDMQARGRDEDSPEAFREHAEAGDPVWVAEVRDTRAPVGFAMLCAPDLPVETGPGDIELKRIYALHRVHGMGVGRRLLEAVEAHAREAGRSRLLLGVHAENPTIAWYGRRGFAAVGTRRFRVGGAWFDDLVMAKSL